MMVEPTDPALIEISRKVHSGVRLEAADGEALYATRDLHALGSLADLVRRRRHGGRTFYIVNRHINYTNRCVLACLFCGFRRSPGDADAIEMSLQDVAAVAESAAQAGAREVHVTGGLHPKWKIDRYEQMLAAIRQSAPAIHIKAFTAVEIAHIARLSGLSVAEVLGRLAAAGLGSMPGGGAEIFDERVHAKAFRHKIGAEDWFEVHRVAHGMALRSNATMLYGHVETPAQRVAHMIRLRELQDRTHGFQAFVPLSFVPGSSPLSHLPGPTGLDDIRTVAVSRLMLDNFDHIKTFWVMHTLKLSQLALHFGADDVDGTVVRYEIVHAAEGGEVTVEQLRRTILECGLEPVERDSFYRPVA